MVTVMCSIPHSVANPPRKEKGFPAANSEITFPLEESVFVFRAPASLPIYLAFPYEGYGGGALNEARLNGKIAERGSLNGKIVNRNSHKGDRIYWETAPIVFTGTRNRLVLIMSDSSNE